jgi:hypothetical protein
VGGLFGCSACLLKSDQWRLVCVYFGQEEAEAAAAEEEKRKKVAKGKSDVDV